MEYKIIQILNAPNDMYSVYEDKQEELKCKIICLALIEYNDGEREVVPMDVSSDGTISVIADNFKCIC